MVTELQLPRGYFQVPKRLILDPSRSERTSPITWSKLTLPSTPTQKLALLIKIGLQARLLPLLEGRWRSLLFN